MPGRPLFRLLELLEQRFEADRARLAERYDGRWVAYGRDGVVAVCDSKEQAAVDALEWCAPGTFLVMPVTKVRHPSTRLVRT